MYCKKCKKEYKKDKKVCKDCGIALTPGKAPGKEESGNKRMIIIGCSVLAVLLAVFLIIGLGGMLPEQLKGTWYDESGSMGTVEFMPGGQVSWSHANDAGATYYYNAGTGEGKIKANGTEHSFTCDGNTLILDGATFKKQSA